MRCVYNIHIVISSLFAILVKLTRWMFGDVAEEWESREASILSRWVSKEASFEATVTLPR